MGIKLSESNYITITIIIKFNLTELKEKHHTIGCRPKMFLGKVNPVYFVHHISCLVSLKLHSLRFAVHATFKMNKFTAYKIKLPSFLLLPLCVQSPQACREGGRGYLRSAANHRHPSVT